VKLDASTLTNSDNFYLGIILISVLLMGPVVIVIQLSRSFVTRKSFFKRFGRSADEKSKVEPSEKKQEVSRISSQGPKLPLKIDMACTTSTVPLSPSSLRSGVSSNGHSVVSGYTTTSAHSSTTKTSTRTSRTTASRNTTKTSQTTASGGTASTSQSGGSTSTTSASDVESPEGAARTSRALRNGSKTPLVRGRSPRGRALSLDGKPLAFGKGYV
jgi:hypothetical protein